MHHLYINNFNYYKKIDRQIDKKTSKLPNLNLNSLSNLFCVCVCACVFLISHLWPCVHHIHELADRV